MVNPMVAQTAMDPGTLMLVVAVLAIAGVGGVFYAVFAPRFADEARRTKRLAGIDRLGRDRGKNSKSRERASSQNAVQKRIKELADREKEKKRRLFDIKARIVQAGLKTEPMSFMMIFFGMAAVGFFVVFMSGQPIWAGLALAAIISFGMPRFVLGYLIRRRRRKFIENLANAIDVMIRGVRSGLPINEGLRVIAREIPDPVKTEFQMLVDAISVGVPMDDALNRMYDRMPIPEVNFFRTVLLIQKQTGGNLSDALSNLSQILRDRKKLKGKIRALSSEARTSAAIIGSLPFIVAGMVYVVSPDYINVLFHDERGHYLIAASLVWMSFGVLTMRSLINFEI